MKPMTLEQLDRNDVAGALALYERGVRDGTWTPDHAQVAITLQDDPDELFAGMEQLYQDPTFAEKLDAIVARAAR